MPSCGVLPHADCTLSAEPGRSYELFFVTTAGFSVFMLLSSVLWGRGVSSFTVPLTWTLLTALVSGLLAGLLIRGSQTPQLDAGEPEKSSRVILPALVGLAASHAACSLILCTAPPVTGAWILKSGGLNPTHVAS